MCVYVCMRVSLYMCVSFCVTLSLCVRIIIKVISQVSGLLAAGQCICAHEFVFFLNKRGHLICPNVVELNYTLSLIFFLVLRSLYTYIYTHVLLAKICSYKDM